MSSFKNFSAAQSAPSEEKPTDTTKDAPATNQPQPDKTPSEVKDAPKA